MGQARPVLAGIAAGFVVAYFLANLLASLLFRAGPRDLMQLQG